MTMSYSPAKGLGVFIPALQHTIFLSQTLFFFSEHFYAREKGIWGFQPAQTSLLLSLLTYVNYHGRSLNTCLSQQEKWQGCHWTWCFLAGQAKWHSSKCCSMLWQVSCSWVSCSRSRITSPTVLGMASCSGDAEMPHGVCRGALICGGKVWDTPASNPTWKCHVRLGNSAWLRPSEATKGLWARGSLTPPTFTDGKIEKQSSEITYLRSPKEAVEELGIKCRFHESPNHTASP